MLDTHSITKVISDDLAGDRNFCSYLITQDLETLKGCHLSGITQLALCVGLRLESLPGGIQPEGRRSGEVCLSVGSSTFTLGTRKLHEDQDCLRLSPLPFPWGSLGQAGSLTVQLCWAIQTDGVDPAPLGFCAPLGGLYQ